MYRHDQYSSYLKESSQKARNCIHLQDVNLSYFMDSAIPLSLIYLITNYSI